MATRESSLNTMTNGVEEIIRRLPHSTLHQQPELRAETEPLANNDAQPKKDYNEGEEEIEEENYDEYNNAIVKVSKLRFIAIFIGLSVSVFLASLDQTIVSTALPRIASQFNSLSNINWVGTSYLLTSTVFQPLYGKTSDILGRRALFLFALVIFIAGSALCATAQSMTWLILSRGLAGIGGAGIMSLTQIILTDLTSLKSRGKVLGMIGAMYTISGVFGPLLGGVFTDKLSWRWCFYINLPISGVSLILIGVFLKIPHTPGPLREKIRRIDGVGAFILISSLVLLILGLNWGGKERPWNSPIVIYFLMLGGALLIAFCIYEWKRAHEPIISPELMKQSEPALLLLIRFLLGIFMYTMIYYLPIYFIVVRNSTATSSGLHLLPFIVSASVAAVLFGILVNVVNTYRSPTWFAIVLIIVGVSLATTIDANTGNGKLIGYLLLFGTGVGITMSGLMVAIQINVNRDIISIATAVANFSWSIGGAIGLPAMSSVFVNVLTNRLGDLARQHPDHARSIMMSRNNNNAVWNSGLPDNVRSQLVDAYVETLCLLYQILIPICSFALIFALFLKGKKLRPSRMPTEQEKDDSHATLESTV